MAKSVNEYYSEKMQKLLEMQKNNTQAALPPSTGQRGKAAPRTGRGYYDNFRNRVDADKKAPNSQNQKRTGQRKTPLERTVIDDIREGKRPRPHSYQDLNKKPKSSDEFYNQRKRPRVSPEQTAEDKFAESVKQIEAMQTAKRARSLARVAGSQET